MSRQHVSWTVLELDLLAQEMVKARIKNPFKAAMILLSKVQNEVLPDNRRRPITSWNDCLELKRMFGLQWAGAALAATACSKTQEAKELLDPVIVTVEVPQRVNFQDVVAQMDMPTILACLAAKVEEDRRLVQMRSEAQINALLEKLGAAIPRLPERKTIQVFDRQESKPKPARVAIVGPLDRQFSDLIEKVKDQGLYLDVRRVDKDGKEATNISSTFDYCIVTRHVSHAVYDGAKSRLGSNRVYYVDGGITSVFQKLLDIASMQKTTRFNEVQK